MSGKDLIKKARAKEKELELFKQSAEFKERNRKKAKLNNLKQ